MKLDFSVAWASRPCIRAQAALFKNASLLRTGETPVPRSIQNN
jgi:hypothetical protein